MYELTSAPRPFGRQGDTLVLAPERRVQRGMTALTRLFTTNNPSNVLALKSIRADLECLTLADSDAEQQRRLAAGWAAWLAADAGSAEFWFRYAVENVSGPPQAEAAYWLARVRLLGQQVGAMAEYEQRLRTYQGSLSATCYFVDLLWRSGQSARAEQVWKSLRANAKLKNSPDWTLQEARWLLRQGEWTAVDKLLSEWQPTGPLETERHLLLGWVMRSRRMLERARTEINCAAQGVYPGAVRLAWQWIFAATAPTEVWAQIQPQSALALAWMQLQQRRLQGLPAGELTAPLLEPLLRYVKACQGEADFEALLATVPGPFLAARCRWRLALGRVVRREMGAEELLPLVQQAEVEGYRGPPLDSLRQLATAAAAHNANVAALWDQPVAEPGHQSVVRRWALERLGRLPVTDWLPLLARWAQENETDAHNRTLLGRRLLQACLQTTVTPEEGTRACQQAASLLLPDRWSALVLRLQQLPAELTNDPAAPALVQLWLAVEELVAGQSAPQLTALAESYPAVRAISAALQLYDAIRRNVAGVVERLLVEEEPWHGFPEGPPPWLVAAVASIATGAHRSAVQRWLLRWEQNARTDLVGLRQRVGLMVPQAETAVVPGGAVASEWYLHQAACALERGSARAALAWVERTMREDPELNTLTRHADLVRAAIPELRRRAALELLADTLARASGMPQLQPGLLASLESLCGITDLAVAYETAALSPQVAHGLGVYALRAALWNEETGAGTQAVQWWARSWRAWLVWLSTADEPSTELLLDHLFTLQRQQLSGWLARDEVEHARQLWELLASVVAEPAESTPLRAALAVRWQTFREELATDYLLAMREGMAHGEIPEGWRLDYQKGLAELRRFLSLDRDNPRLLTALVEICADWFLDLYNAQDFLQLGEQVERFTPFALQLARRVDKRTGDLSGQVALSEFYKFRGFVAEGWERKKALYQEALEFNPANANVRNLLAELEGRQ